MKRFGKSSDGLLQIKREFFKHNDVLLAEERALARLYSEQPIRKTCKNCVSPLMGKQFARMEVNYIICGDCGHLNGTHEDTDDFCAAVYLNDRGSSYAQTYHEESQAAIEHRLTFVYRPKRDFLFEFLSKDGRDPKQLSYTELGSGSGYFLKTLAEAGVQQVSGHEVSEVQVSFASQLVGSEYCHQHRLDENVEIVERASCDVLVMLGVLEHVQNPREILAAISANDKIQYVFLALPLFSPSVFLESALPEVMPRVLTGGHTHLYTDASLNWIAADFGFERAAEWWFGTDVFDLYRAISVMLQKTNQSETLLCGWQHMFGGLVDDMQHVIDRKKLSSQVHLIFKKLNASTLPQTG